MKEYIGYGSIQNLEKILSKHKARNVFLVTGRKSFTSSGAEKALAKQLGKNTRFYDFEENPKIEDVKRGIKLFKADDYDMVVAVGGGSAIDVAKLINSLAAQDKDPISYILGENKVKKQGVPLVAIPTTSGSGSEATHFAVVYYNKKKYSLSDQSVLPTYCIVDPSLTMSLTPSITASTGMDALSQAIESYWNVHSTASSKKYAKEAIRLILKNIVGAVKKPSKNNREGMSIGAHLAGKAINITKTTAPHAISYPFTTYYGVPHGHAVALTLGNTLVYNAEVSKEDLLDKRGVAYVRKTIGELCKLLGAKTPYEARDRINQIMESIGLETDISSLGVKSQRDYELILDNVNVERLVNNPRKLTPQDVLDYLLK